MSPSNTTYFNYSTFNPLEQQKKSRLVAGLLLTLVVVLHLALALYVLNAPKSEYKKPPVVMEVVMLPKPELIVQQVVKEPPPAPPPAKKTPIKSRPVIKPPKPVKKPVVVKKAAPKPQPTEIKEVILVPKFEPAPASAPAPAAVSSTSSNSRAPAKATGHGRDDSKSVVSGVVPLLRIQPKYPARAADRHIEGWVKIEFTVQTDGSVDDAVVVNSEPEGIFDDAALKAIGKWKFKEKIVNGVAVKQRAVQKITFNLKN